MSDIDDVSMVNPNARKFYDGAYIGKVLLKNGHNNVLTNIKVPEDQRGNGYSRVIIKKWLKWCFNNGHDEAYVVNIKSEIIVHVLDTLEDRSQYKTEKITNAQVPCNIVSGPTIPEVAYKIEK